MAFALLGAGFDIESMMLVAAELSGPRPLELYSELNQESLFRYPYPPGFLAWIGPTDLIADRTPLPFHGVIQVPAILANAGLALVVQAYLGARGSGERTRLLAAGAVVLGPVFVAISGYHGQIDALAILPAVIALVVWEGRSSTVLGILRPNGSWGSGLAIRLDGDRIQRALACGLLIGIGASIKTVPLFLLVALAPSARSWREAALLVGGALAVPLLLLTPFLIADPSGVETLRQYRGLPGLGGLSLAVQPDLAIDWIVDGHPQLNAASEFLYEHSNSIVSLVPLGVLAFVIRIRPSPLDSAVLLWLAIYAFAPNPVFQYLIWGIPFFLMAGHLRGTVLLQAVVLVPILIAYLAPMPTGIAAVYLPIMLGVWAGFVVALFRLGRRAIDNHREVPYAQAMRGNSGVAPVSGALRKPSRRP
ncbi:MAG: glycosyltransferase 87 family protein [Solirubrobacterales bacterium]